MKLDNILGKILALTKQIHFTEPPDGTGFVTKFFAGKTKPFPPIGSIGLEWWSSKSGFNLREDIANMAILFDPQLQGGDTASFCQQIDDILKENVVNREIFDIDKILLMRVNTLFDGRSMRNERDFALKLWNIIHNAFKESMINWIVLYPLNRVNAESTLFDFDGLSLLASNDLDAWKRICKNYSNAKGWDPFTGRRRDSKDENVFNKSPSTWLVCEVVGTESGARKPAGRRMRTFIAVLFSHLCNKIPNLLAKSMAKEISYSTQFPKDGVKVGQVYASIGRLLPPLIVDVNVSLEIISEMTKWYASRSSAQEMLKQRAIAASHFIHYGITADDLERFLHFFIALDALFGEMGKVEETIIKGIKRTFPGDSKWVERAEMLFDLRSELVHGGSSFIDDWKILDHYRRHFQSHPLTDVGTAAMTSLRNYFNLVPA